MRDDFRVTRFFKVVSRLTFGEKTILNVNQKITSNGYPKGKMQD